MTKAYFITISNIVAIISDYNRKPCEPKQKGCDFILNKIANGADNSNIIMRKEF